MTTENNILTDGLPTALAAIARKLHAARSAAHLSLDELAARSGVSKGTLVSLEQGRGNPSVAVLCQVAAALGISLSALVDFAADPAPTPFDPAAGRIVWQGPRGGSARLVVAGPGPDMVELWQWTLPPGERYDAAPHSPGTREILLVQSGRLAVSAGAWSGIVAPGAGLLVTTDVAHAYWCEGRKPAVFQMFVAEWPRRA
jgi:transcriptional regulator with XRE-family HTH domain